jgi:hypothetical protein
MCLSHPGLLSKKRYHFFTIFSPTEMVQLLLVLSRSRWYLIYNSAYDEKTARQTTVFDTKRNSEMAALWNVVSHSLVGIARRFRGDYCLSHQDDSAISQEAAIFHSRRPKNLKSQPRDTVYNWITKKHGIKYKTIKELVVWQVRTSESFPLPATRNT